MHTALQHQRMREVVDVLGGARKVHEFRVRRQLRQRLEFVLDPVFNGLDVVIGRCLNRLDRRRVSKREIIGQIIKKFHSFGRQRG